MLERLLSRSGGHYVLLMMLLTRPLCCVGGALTIYYIYLSMALPAGLLTHLVVYGGVWIVL